MPRVKWIGRPDLEEMILGRASKNDISDRKLAEMAGISPAAFCARKKIGLLKQMSYEQTMQMVKGLDISLEDYAATLPLRSEGGL